MKMKSVFPTLSWLISLILIAAMAQAGDLGSASTIMGATQGDVAAAQRVDELWPFAEREVDHIDTLWWTGNIDLHIFGGQTVSWQPDLPQMTGVLMQIKYGLWNSPEVYLDVTVNNQLIGTLVANLGYISPGPRYATANISNYIVAGPDMIQISAQPGGGEAVIGYIGAGVRTTRDASSDGMRAPDAECSLFHSSPNPFNPATTLEYLLTQGAKVRLDVFDTSGRIVATLVDGYREAGSHQATWDASGLPSGMYLARIAINNNTRNQKLLLTK